MRIQDTWTSFLYGAAAIGFAAAVYGAVSIIRWFALSILRREGRHDGHHDGHHREDSGKSDGMTGNGSEK